MPDPTQIWELTIQDSPCEDIIQAKFSLSVCLPEIESAGIALPLSLWCRFHNY